MCLISGTVDEISTSSFFRYIITNIQFCWHLQVDDYLFILTVEHQRRFYGRKTDIPSNYFNTYILLQLKIADILSVLRCKISNFFNNDN